MRDEPVDAEQTQEELDDLIARGDNLLAASRALLANLDEVLASGDGPLLPPPPRPKR